MFVDRMRELRERIRNMYGGDARLLSADIDEKVNVAKQLLLQTHPNPEVEEAGKKKSEILLDEVKTAYRRQHTMLTNFLDDRKQDDKAEFWDRARYTTFRLLTTIGIAMIVMASYYVADRLGIPMPLRMPSQFGRPMTAWQAVMPRYQLL